MIRWTETAYGHLENLCEYIAQANSAAVAEKVIDRVFQSIQHLESAPMMGRSGRVSGTRELVVTATPFLVSYRVDKGIVFILAIYHGAQQWPKALL